MQTTTHHASSNVLASFPNARAFQTWEGGCAYLAERNGAAYVILDEGTMADVVAADDRDLLKELVKVLRFDDEAERDAFVQQRLASAAGVFFLPWVGDRYAAGDLGVRLLVLGESHYSKDAPRPEFTRWLTREYVEGRMTHRFWTRLARTISGRTLGRDECRAFWHSVTFYNFIQELVGGRARVRPTPEMWSAAQGPFQHVLSMLDPDAVLVVGSQLWDHLPDAPRGELQLGDGSKWPTRQYERPGRPPITATFIKHPAWPRFSVNDSSRVAAALRRA